MSRMIIFIISALIIWALVVWSVVFFLKGCEFTTETAKCSCDLEKTLEEARKRAEQETTQTTQQATEQSSGNEAR